MGGKHGHRRERHEEEAEAGDDVRPDDAPRPTVGGTARSSGWRRQAWSCRWRCRPHESRSPTCCRSVLSLLRSLASPIRVEHVVRTVAISALIPSKA